jgi:hypothetical protein
MQIVTRAIEASKASGGKCEYIDAIDMRQAHVSWAAVRAELLRECDQEVTDGDSTLTYEGKDSDGNRWRVAIADGARS